MPRLTPSDADGLGLWRLISAYVDVKRVDGDRGQITAYPHQLESLVWLAEAHAKMQFSDSMEILDVDEV